MIDENTLRLFCASWKHISLNANTLNIIVSAPPKSASTFLARFLARALCEPGSASDQTLLHAADPDGHPAGYFIDIPKALLCKLRGENSVTQSHLVPDPATCDLMKKLEFVPVVSSRNLFDSVVSLKRQWHIDWQKDYNKIMNKGHYLQMHGTISSSTVDWLLNEPDEKTFDFIIETTVPWYLNFLLTWATVRRTRAMKAYYVFFDELVEDETATLTKLLRFIGAGAQDEHYVSTLSEALKRTSEGNFNLGISGQGREKLSRSQIGRIMTKASYYGDDEWLKFHIN